MWTRWNMPNTLGCIDGKHIEIKKPANSGSLHYNYKGPFSLPVLILASPFFFLGMVPSVAHNMMKPFSGMDCRLNAIFNYRLSRCRRLIENVFGMLALKWRILLSAIEARPETADWIVKAAFAYTTLSWKSTPIMTKAFGG
uniref:DDE Tnp4 domain-containing protein n=1 Tax=Ditylenchus dipsaci TaxID=166011 RepID=A0A915E1T4_9BILA